MAPINVISQLPPQYIQHPGLCRIVLLFLYYHTMSTAKITFQYLLTLRSFPMASPKDHHIRFINKFTTQYILTLCSSPAAFSKDLRLVSD